MPEFFQPLLDWISQQPQWLNVSIFLIALLECLALIGIIWPGVILIFSLAVMAGQAGLPLWPMLLLAWGGAFLGNSLSFLLGARLQQQTQKLPLLRKHPEWLAHAELHLTNYGAASLFIGHFIGLLRPLLPLFAGMFKMPLRFFTSINLASSALWAFSCVIPGWLVGAALDLTPPAGFWQQALPVLAGVLLLPVLGLYLRHASQRLAYLAVTASALLLSLLVFWPQLSTFDLFLQQLSQSARLPVLDKIAVAMTLLGDVKLHLVLDALLCGALLLYRSRGALYFVVGTLLGSTLLNALFKKVIARARPDLLLEPLSGFSLPSGHSVRSFAFCLVLAVLFANGKPWRWRMLILALACIPALLISASRVYLTAHWPTDIIAGALLAISTCVASLAVLQNTSSLAPLPGRFWRHYLGLAGLIAGAFILWKFSATLVKYSY